jgi:acyl carrier protein
VQAAAHLNRDGPVWFERLFLLRPLLLEVGTCRHVQLLFSPSQQGWALQLLSAPTQAVHGRDDEWSVHMVGEARIPATDELTSVTGVDLSLAQAAAVATVSGGQFYEHIWANQGGTGSAFRWIRQLWHRGAEALAQTQAPAFITMPQGYRLHPGQIEAACQVLHACGQIETAAGVEREGVTFVPFSVDRLVVPAPTSTDSAVWCHARLLDRSADSVRADLTLIDSNGRLHAAIEGFTLRPIGRDALSPVAARNANATNQLELQALMPAPIKPMKAQRPMAGAVDGLLDYLLQQLSEISGHPNAELVAERSFIELGMDSLMAVILINRLRRDLGSIVTVATILQSASIRALAAGIQAQRLTAEQ